MLSVRGLLSVAVTILGVTGQSSFAFADCVAICGTPDWDTVYTNDVASCTSLGPPRDATFAVMYDGQIDFGSYVAFMYGCYDTAGGHTPSENWGGHCCSQPKIAASAPSPSAPPLNPTGACGSYITLEDRSVSESIPLIGVPFQLIYSSSNSVSKVSAFTLDIPVIGAALPSGVTSVDVDVQIAGRTFSQSYTTANSIYHLVWDGLDSSSNYVGSAVAQITTTPHYSGTTDTWPVVQSLPVGIPRSATGIGSWRISSVHFYDLATSKLWEGNGASRSVKAQALSPSGYRVASRYGDEVYIFNSSGYHTETLDALSGATILSVAYDTSNRVSTLTDAYGNITTINRTLLGVPTSIVGPYGQTTTLVMNSDNDLASATGPDSSVYSVTYDSASKLLATFSKPSGEISTFTFATDGKILSDSSSGGPTMSYTDWYDYSNGYGADHYTVETSALGRTRQVTDLAYPYAGMNKTITYSSGETTQVSDAPMTQTSGGGYTSYDSGSSYYRFTSFDGDIRFGKQVEFENGGSIANGNYLSLSVSQILTPARTDDVNLPMNDPFDYTSLQTTWSINSNNWIANFVKATGVRTTTSPVGRVSTEARNSTGQLVSAQHAAFAPMLFAYDSKGRLHTITQSARVSTLNYNSVGLLSSVMNPLSQTTSYTYDNANRLLTATLPDSLVITYSYDSGGNLASVTPPSSPMHELIKDVLGNLTNYKAPSLGAGTLNTLYSYNNDRQLTTITRPDSSVINFNYGSTTGLLDSITSGSQTQSMVYQGGNRLVSSTSFDSIQLDIGYSHMQPQTISYSGAGKGEVYFSYDTNLNLSSVQIGTGSAYSYLYDNDGLLKKTGNETINRSATTGFLSDTSIGNAKEYYTYDSTYGEIASYQAKYTTSTNKLLEQYTRDDLGRISTRTVTIGTGTPDVYAYTYDSAGRLTDVTKNSTSIGHYVYDSNSNRTSSTNSAATFTATYDAQDRLSTYGTLTFSYSLNGERTSRVDSSLSPGTTSYTWDVFSNLKQVVLPSGTQINYKYDGLNRRVTRLTGTTVNARYVYLDQTRVLGVLNSSGSTVMTFFYGVRNTPEYMIKSGTTYKFFVDHVGSVRQVINTSNGTVAQELTYDEFGRVLSDSSPGFQPFGFAGGLYDKDTGLTQFGERWYDAEVGSFLSKDPILFAGGDANLYGYVENDPINWIDSEGLSKILPHEGGGGASLPGSRGGGPPSAGSGVGEGRVGETKCPDFSNYGQAGPRANVRIGSGGPQAGQQLFNELAEGGRPATPSGYGAGQGQAVIRSDGTFVGIRPLSRGGPMTIDIKVPGMQQIKIKFPDTK